MTEGTKVRAAIMGAAIVAVALLAGCGSSSSQGTASTSSGGSSQTTTTAAGSSDSGSSSGSGSGITIGYAAPILAGVPDQQATVAGMQAVGKLLGWKVVPNDAHLSTSAQISALDTFTTQKMNGIAVAVLDPHGEEPALDRVRKAGVPLIGILSSLPQANTDIAEDIYSPTCSAGADAAAFIKQRTPNAKVLVVGGVAVPTIQQAATCFEKEAKAAGLQVQARQDNTQDTATAAQTIATDLLTKYPDVQAVWASNEDTMFGVQAALQAAGKSIYSKANQKGVVLVGGCCGAPEGIQAIKEGRATALYDGDSFQAGARAMGALSIVNTLHKPTSAMPHLITIPWKRWDYENVGEWQALAQRPVSQFVPK